MDDNRFSQRLTVVIAVVLGLLSAIVLGKMAAQGQLSSILLAGIGAICVTLILILKERIWIVLLLTWPMTGQVRALNIPLGVRDIVVIYTLAGYIALIAFKIIRKKGTYTNIDFFMSGVLLLLVIAFMRNPVGVDALNSERVGGRPYFSVAIALIAYWVLSRARLRDWSPVFIVLVILVGRCFDGVAVTTLALIPGLDQFVAEFYASPIMTTGVIDDYGANPLAESSERLAYLGFLASPIAVGLFAIDRPLSWMNIFRPWKPLILAITVIMLLKSGFRSALAVIAMVGIVSSYLRGGRWELMKIFGIGGVSIFLLASLNGTFFQLPRNVQRSLSFLPGNWDAVAMADAGDSTKWRLFMWEQALFTDRYIENKIIGDGFGMRKNDLAVMNYLGTRGGNETNQENMMISGNFHSGPITTIKYVGYIGLGFYLIFIGMLAKESWVLCKLMRNSKYFLVALLVGLPLIVEPIAYVFVFGSFDYGFPDAIFALGMLKLLRTALPQSQNRQQTELQINSKHSANTTLIVGAA